jgi:hypothetical protein
MTSFDRNRWAEFIKGGGADGGGTVGSRLAHAALPLPLRPQLKDHGSHALLETVSRDPQIAWTTPSVFENYRRSFRRIAAQTRVCTVARPYQSTALLRTVPAGSTFDIPTGRSFDVCEIFESARAHGSG